MLIYRRVRLQWFFDPLVLQSFGRPLTLFDAVTRCCNANTAEMIISLFHEMGVLKNHVTATICLIPGCCTYHSKYLANWTQKHHHCQPNSTSNTPQTLTYFTALATVLLLNNMQSWGRGSKMLQMWCSGFYDWIIPLHPDEAQLISQVLRNWNVPRWSAGSPSSKWMCIIFWGLYHGYSL